MNTLSRRILLDIPVNPVLVKELRSRMRGRRTFIFLTLYLLALVGIVSLIYFAFTAVNQAFSITTARDAGLGIFYSLLIFQVFLVIFVGPALTTGAITGEKEHQTYDLIRTTTLSAKSLVWGKLLAALSFILLLILTMIPLQSLIFFMGGVSIQEFLISQLLIISAAVAFTMFGLFSSVISRSTLMANILAFGGVVLFVFVLPLILLLLVAILAPNVFMIQSPVWFQEALLTYTGLVLVATNLPATLLLSKVILDSENSFLLFQESFGGHEVWFLSPWPLFILFSILLTILLFATTVWRLKRPVES